MNYKILKRPWGRECIFSSENISSSILLPDLTTDPTSLVNAEIARIQAIPVPIPEKPSVLLDLEDDKESKKWLVINYMRSNPTAKSSEYLSTLSWFDSVFVQTLIHKYATNTVAKGFGSLPEDTLEACWSLLSGVANALTIKQLREIL